MTVMTGSGLRNTVIGKLIPVAAKVRDIATKLGLRRYQVFRVVVGWSGLRRGEGVAQVMSEDMLDPVPRALFSSALVMTEGGLTAAGGVTLTGLNGAYTREFLLGLGPAGEALDPSLELFYEVLHLDPDGGQGTRDRYTLAKMPLFIPGALGWTIELVTQAGERTRTGSPHEPGRVW